MQNSGILTCNFRYFYFTTNTNFIDIYSESTNFICLIALDDETSIDYVCAIDSIMEFKAPLYVETELENFDKFCNKESAQKKIELIIPNLPQKIDPIFPITVVNTKSDIGIPFVSTDDINIMFREPNIVGFYTDVRLFDKEDYSKKLKEYTQLINNFAIDYKNMMKKQFGTKEFMKLNFLFDYEKQYLFDSRGVLYSDTAKKLAELDENDKYVQEWLRKSAVKL